MSGFELKNAAAHANEPNLPGTIAMPRSNGAVSCEPSDALAGRFVSLSLIRVHGDTALYQAIDKRATSGDDLVTLRVHRGNTDKASLELFRLESFAAAKLSHRHITRSSPPQEIHGIHFSVIERRSDVETLKDLLDRQGWLDLDLAIRIVQQIADALEHSHRLGVLHLRVHPENILIDRNGAAYLTDFGLDAGNDLAWAHKRRSSNCPVHYISPEQAAGRPLDSRSDIYSLGVVLYQMLTDRLPIDSQDPEMVSHKHLTQSPMAPHSCSPEISSSLSAVIMCMLEKDPGARFQGMASLCAALDECANHANQSGALVSGNEDWTSQFPIDAAEDGQCAIDSEDFLSEPILELWEQPTITVIEPPLDEILPLDLAADASPPEEKSREYSDELESPRHRNLVGDHLNSPAVSSRQWSHVLLVVVLAIAAISGVIVLAHANRSSSPPIRTAPGSTLVDQRSEAVDRDGTAASSDRRNEGSSSSGGQGIGDRPLPANRPPQTAAPAQASFARQSTAARVRPRQSKISLTSQHLRTQRRKSSRPTLYFRQSRDYDRRYSQR